MPNCTSDFNVNGQGPVPTIDREIAEAKALGAVNVRLEIPWPIIETTRGVYDWGRSDTIMAAAKSARMTIQPILTWTPLWAGGGSALNLPPSPADMSAFASAYATRYNGQVPVIEIWNEADGGRYLYNGSAATYVSDILNPSYSAIKAVNSAIQVEMSGSYGDAGSCCPFLTGVISNGGKFDIAAFHNYFGTGLSEAQSYRNITSKPIWMGEYGVQSSAGNQSTLISSVLTGSSPLAMAQWYNLRDTGAWNCCPPSEVDTATWGLIGANFSPKASYATMRSLLGGSTLPPPPPPQSGHPSPSPFHPKSPSPRPSLTPSASPGHHSHSPLSTSNATSGNSGPGGGTAGTSGLTQTWLASLSRGGSQTLDLAILLVGAIGFALGLALAMNVGAMATRVSRLRGSTADLGSTVGFGLATAGAILSLCAILLVSLLPGSG